MPADQPPMWGTRLSLGGGDKWIHFQYEKLLFCCFKYGLIGHRFRECVDFLEVDVDSGSDSFPYPKSLEVEPRKERRAGVPETGSSDKVVQGEDSSGGWSAKN